MGDNTNLRGIAEPGIGPHMSTAETERNDVNAAQPICGSGELSELDVDTQGPIAAVEGTVEAAEQSERYENTENAHITKYEGQEDVQDCDVRGTFYFSGIAAPCLV